MEYVKSFRELEVYKLSREVAKEIFILSKSFPKDEKYSLTDQIRRSSRSSGAQIAEAWGKRRYELHFISKLTDADAEQLETQHWIEISEESEYIDHKTSNNLLMKCESIGKMIQKMIDKSSSFCNKGR
jgi:four helix bundle protein